MKKFDASKAFKSGIIQVFTVSVRKERDYISEYESYLSLDERAKASLFKFQVDRERFIVARAILRILSGYFLSLSPKLIRFKYGEYGKPDYASNENLKFNISHSGDLIVLGFTQKCELGIDVELIKTDFDVLKLAKTFFSISEITALEKQPTEELARAFFRCWTRKESFIKAEGSGLSFPLDQFAVSLDDDFRAELLQTNWDTTENLNWTLFSFTPSEQYIGALAVRNRLSKIQYFEWNVSWAQFRPTSKS